MIYLLLLFFCLSAFFSGLETGFLTLDKIALKLEADKSKISKKIYSLCSNIEKVISSILIGNNLANIALASLFTYYCTKSFKTPYSSEILSLFLSGFMVIFAESLPKILYKEYPDELVKKSLPIFLVFYKLFYPFSLVISGIIKKLEGDEKISEEKILPYQLASILDDEDEERKEDLIQEGLEFSVVEARKIMTPRTDIVAINEDEQLQEAINLAKESGYTRFPVYTESIDKIVGILTLYDLLQVDKKNIKDIMRKPHFAPDNIEIDKLLRNMQSNKSVFCVLVDSYGGTSGIVTIEDILEELVGEIEDEYDLGSEVLVKQLNENTFMINGKTEIDYLNEEYKLDLPESQDYNTIAGLMLFTMESIPKTGDNLRIGNCQLTVEKSDNKTLKRIKLVRK